MKKLFSRGNRLLIVGFLLTLTFWVSCSKDHDDDHQGTTVAGFMAFNLAPDKPLIGVALSGRQLNSPLAYMSFTGGYIAIFPGERLTEAFDLNSGNTFVTSSYSYLPDHYYSLFVTGARDSFQNIIVTDNLDSLSAGTGKSFIRYINAIPDSSKPMITISQGQKEVVHGSAGFNVVSEFIPLDTGSVTIAINNDSTIQSQRTISLENSKIYTVLFIGDPAGDAVSDSIQIRYIQNGTSRIDSTDQNSTKSMN